MAVGLHDLDLIEEPHEVGEVVRADMELLADASGKSDRCPHEQSDVLFLRCFRVLSSFDDAGHSEAKDLGIGLNEGANLWAVDIDLDALHQSSFFSRLIFNWPSRRAVLRFFSSSVAFGFGPAGSFF